MIWRSSCRGYVGSVSVVFIWDLYLLLLPLAFICYFYLWFVSVVLSVFVCFFKNARMPQCSQDSLQLASPSRNAQVAAFQVRAPFVEERTLKPAVASWNQQRFPKFIFSIFIFSDPKIVPPLGACILSYMSSFLMNQALK